MLGPFYRERPFALSLTRVRAACEQAERIEKVKKLCESNEKERERRNVRDGAVFRLRGIEIPRMLSVFGKRCPVFVPDGRNERHERGKGVVQRRGNYQERSVGARYRQRYCAAG